MHKGADVVDGACFFCARLPALPQHASDEQKRGDAMISLLGHAMLDALGKKAPTPRAVAKRTDDAGSSKRVQPATADLAGGLTMKEAGTTLVALDAALPLNAADFSRCVHALAVVRARAQGFAGTPTWQSSECSALRSMLAAFKPTEIARMLRWAGADDFWRGQSLSFHVVEKNAQTWLTNAGQTAPKPKDRKASAMVEAARLLALLKPRAPVLADEIAAIDTRFFNDVQWAEMVARINHECATRSIKTETTT